MEGRRKWMRGEKEVEEGLGVRERLSGGRSEAVDKGAALLRQDHS